MIKINMSPILSLHQKKKDDVIEMTPNMEIPHIYAFCPFPTLGNIPLMNGNLSMTECKLFLIVTYKIYSDLVKSVRGWDVNAVTIYE